MSMDFWLGCVAGFVAALGLLFVYVFLPEGGERRDTDNRNDDDRDLLTC